MTTTNELLNDYEFEWERLVKTHPYPQNLPNPLDYCSDDVWRAYRVRQSNIHGGVRASRKDYELVKTLFNELDFIQLNVLGRLLQYRELASEELKLKNAAITQDHPVHNYGTLTHGQLAYSMRQEAQETLAILDRFSNCASYSERLAWKRAEEEFERDFGM